MAKTQRRLFLTQYPQKTFGCALLCHVGHVISKADFDNMVVNRGKMQSFYNHMLVHITISLYPG